MGCQPNNNGLEMRELPKIINSKTNPESNSISHAILSHKLLQEKMESLHFLKPMHREKKDFPFRTAIQSLSALESSLKSV